MGGVPGDMCKQIRTGLFDPSGGDFSLDRGQRRNGGVKMCHGINQPACQTAASFHQIFPGEQHQPSARPERRSRKDEYGGDSGGQSAFFQLTQTYKDLDAVHDHSGAENPYDDSRNYPEKFLSGYRVQHHAFRFFKIPCF